MANGIMDTFCVAFCPRWGATPTNLLQVISLMLLRVNHPEIPLQQYASLLPHQLMDDLVGLSEQFRGLRFVHANSTATGGGVAEILQSLVPFMNTLGLPTERIVVSPEDPQFFQVTKRIHNLLQGSSGSLSQEELAVYFQCME